MGGWSTGPVPVLLLAFLVGAATAFSKNFVNSSMPEMRPTFVVNFDMSTVICQHSSDPTDLHLHEMSILCDGKKDCFTNPAMHDESFPYCERKCNSTCNNRGACLYDGEKPQCYCNSGFSGPSCELVDKNECLDRPCHLMAHCQNTLGGYNCECFKGFHGDGYHCADIDECATEDICPEHSVCVNLPGTHYCNCTEGFAQKGDALLTKCVDINECELGIHNCDKHQMCENTIGSFTCVSRCTEGYEYVNGECVDIDECRRTNTCDPRAECFNSPGSYSCVCEEGMTGDGKHCEPITDCSQRDDICDRHALCIPALKMCYCQAGYAGDGLTCHDVNECEASENLCANQKGNRCVNVDGGYICCDEGMDDERCIQDKGAFCSGGCGLNAWCSNRTCECLDGFSGDPSKKCTDINECDADNMCPGVGQWCVNTLGNYTCCGAGSQEAECQGAHIFKTLDGKTAILHHNYTIGESLGETGEASEKQAGGFIAVGKGVIRANGTLPSISVNSKRACTSYCPVNSECVNGFCECLPGFGGNPHFGCEDINECLTTFPCQEDNDHWCLNTEGSFLCCDRNSSDSDCLGLEIVPGGMRLTHSQANQDGDDLFASTHNESSRNEVISEREHGSLNRSEGGFIIVQKNNNKTVPSDIVVLKPTATGTDSADLLKPSSGEEGLEIVPDRLTTAGIDGSIPQSRSTVSGEESTTALPIEAVTLPGVISTLGGHSTATTSIPITAIPVHIPQTPETKEVKSNTTTSIVVSSTLKPLTEIEGSGETTGIEDVDMLQTGKTSTVATPTPGGNINVHFTTLEELQKKNQTQTGATVATIQPAGGVTGKGSLETTIEGHNGSDVKVVDTVVGTTIRTIKVEGSGIEATTPGSHEDREDATAETGLEIILETTPTIVHHREATAPSIEQNTTSANKEEETTSTATSETTKADIKESESTTASQDKANGTTDKATSAVTQATEKIPETTSASEVTPDVTASSSAIGNDGNKPTTPSGSEETTVASAVTEESTTQTETSSVKGDETTSPSTSAKISAATTETTDPIPAARTTVKEAGATGATIEVPKETSTLETTTSIEDLNKKISDVLGKLKNSTKLPETTTEATGTKNLPTGEADSKKDEAKGNGTTLEPSTENPKRSDTKPETSKSTGGPTAVTTQAPVSATEETSAETGLEIANVEIEKTTPSSTVAYTADPKETAASTETTNKSEKATSTVAPGVTPEKVDTDETSSVALKSTPVTPETEKSIETTESTTTTTGVTPNKTTDKASFESSTKDETSQKPEPVPSSSSVPEVATSEKSAESTTSSVNSVETTTDNSAVFSTPKDVTGTTPSFKDITPATDSSTSIVEEGSGSEGKDTPGLVGEEGEKASTVVDDKIKTTARPTVADREPIGTIKTTEKPGNAQGVSSTEIPLTTEKTTAETGLEIVSEGTTVVAVGSPEETTSAPTEAATIVETVTETGSGGKNATSGIKTPEKGIGSKHISIVSSKEEPAPERDIHGGEETETQNGADGVHPTTESTTLETGLEIVHEKPLPTTTTPEVIEKTTTEDTTDGTAETGLEIVPAGTTTAGTEHTDETTTSPSSGKPVSTVSSSAESSTTSATVPSKTTEGSVSATSTESATKIVEPVTAAGKIEEKATKSPGIDGEIVTPLPDGDMTASPKTESTKQNRQPTGVTDLPGEGTTKDTFALPKDGSNQLATLTPNNVTKCVSGDECGDDAQCERRTGACRCYPGFEGAPPQTPCADVDECATGLHKCHSSTRCHNFVGGYACFCPMGYRKNESGVCIDIDECAESRGSCCSPNGMCFNKHGSYGCKCKPGFFGDGYNCMPVEKRACNETELTDAKCGQHNICGVDGLGNIDCDSCKMGFKMINGTCTDINECVEPGLSMCDKNANCNNLIGTYACQCKDGFRGDGYMCEDIDECTRNPCHPQAQCTNLPGSFLCACPSGFGGDGVKECTNPLEKSCEDVAGFCGRFSHTACLSVKLFNGSLSSVCECEPGYRFNKKLNKCEDIDECLENRHNCDPASATCINEDGGFHCECAEGYEGVGGVCVDVNECERGTAGCHAMAMCLNQPGSCGCKCMNGFTGDGTQCNPMQKREEEENLCTAEWNRLCLLENKTCHVDEEDVPQCGSCIEGHHPVNGSCQPLQGAGNCADPKKNTCDPNAECIDVHPGRHFCSCKVGYIGDGMRCDDIDECSLTGICHPHATCTNLPGLFNCTCNPGYTGNGFTCTKTQGPNCHLDGRLCHAEAECNIDGKCKCKSGFEGDGINNCTASTAGDKETTEAEPGKNGTTTVDGNVTTESMGTTAQTEPTTGTTTVVSEVTSVGTTVSTQVTTEKPDMSISGKPRLEATERPSTEHTTSVTPETTNASTSGLKTKGNAEPRTSSGTTVSTEGTTGQLGLEIARIPSNGTTTVASETTTSVTTLESKTNGSSESKSPAGTTISTRVTTEQPDTTISEKTELDITKVSSIGGSTSIASTSTASPSTSGIETNIGESSSSPDVTTETSPTGETTTDQGDFVLSFTKSTSTVAPSTTLQASSTGALSTGVSSGSTTEKPVTQTPSTESVVSSTTSQPAETTTGSESVLSASRTTKETSHSTAETPEFRASSTLSSTTSVSTTSDPAFTTKSASSSSSVGVSSVNPETSTSPSKTNKPPAESQTSTATTIASSITSTSGLTSLTDSSFVALKSTTEQPDLVLSGSKTTVKEEGSVSTGTTVVPTKSTVSSTVAVTSHASKTTLDLETTTPPSINAASTASMSESSTRPGVVIEIEDPDIVELVTGSSVVHLSGNKETLSSSTSAPTTVSTAAATSATAVSSSAFPTLGKTSSEPVPPSTTQAPKTTKSSGNTNSNSEANLTSTTLNSEAGSNTTSNPSSPNDQPENNTGGANTTDLTSVTHVSLIVTTTPEAPNQHLTTPFARKGAIGLSTTEQAVTDTTSRRNTPQEQANFTTFGKPEMTFVTTETSSLEKILSTTSVHSDTIEHSTTPFLKMESSVTVTAGNTESTKATQEFATSGTTESPLSTSSELLDNTGTSTTASSLIVSSESSRITENHGSTTATSSETTTAEDGSTVAGITAEIHISSTSSLEKILSTKSPEIKEDELTAVSSLVTDKTVSARTKSSESVERTEFTRRLEVTPVPMESTTSENERTVHSSSTPSSGSQTVESSSRKTNKAATKSEESEKTNSPPESETTDIPTDGTSQGRSTFSESIAKFETGLEVVPNSSGTTTPPSLSSSSTTEQPDLVISMSRANFTPVVSTTSGSTMESDHLVSSTTPNSVEATPTERVTNSEVKTEPLSEVSTELPDATLSQTSVRSAENGSAGASTTFGVPTTEQTELVISMSKTTPILAQSTIAAEKTLGSSTTVSSVSETTTQPDLVISMARTTPTVTGGTVVSEISTPLFKENDTSAANFAGPYSMVPETSTSAFVNESTGLNNSTTTPLTEVTIDSASSKSRTIDPTDEITDDPAHAKNESSLPASASTSLVNGETFTSAVTTTEESSTESGTSAVESSRGATEQTSSEDFEIGSKATPGSSSSKTSNAPTESAVSMSRTTTGFNETVTSGTISPSSPVEITSEGTSITQNDKDNGVSSTTSVTDPTSSLSSVPSITNTPVTQTGAEESGLSPSTISHSSRFTIVSFPRETLGSTEEETNESVTTRPEQEEPPATTTGSQETDIWAEEATSTGLDSGKPSTTTTHPTIDNKGNTTHDQSELSTSTFPSTLHETRTDEHRISTSTPLFISSTQRRMEFVDHNNTSSTSGRVEDKDLLVTKGTSVRIEHVTAATGRNQDVSTGVPESRTGTSATPESSTSETTTVKDRTNAATDSNSSADTGSPKMSSNLTETTEQPDASKSTVSNKESSDAASVSTTSTRNPSVAFTHNIKNDEKYGNGSGSTPVVISTGSTVHEETTSPKVSVNKSTTEASSTLSSEKPIEVSTVPSDTSLAASTGSSSLTTSAEGSTTGEASLEKSTENMASGSSTPGGEANAISSTVPSETPIIKSSTRAVDGNWTVSESEVSLRTTSPGAFVTATDSSAEINATEALLVSTFAEKTKATAMSTVASTTAESRATRLIAKQATDDSTKTTSFELKGPTPSVDSATETSMTVTFEALEATHPGTIISIESPKGREASTERGMTSIMEPDESSISEPNDSKMPTKTKSEVPKDTTAKPGGLDPRDEDATQEPKDEGQVIHKPTTSGEDSRSESTTPKNERSSVSTSDEFPQGLYTIAGDSTESSNRTKGSETIISEEMIISTPVVRTTETYLETSDATTEHPERGTTALTSEVALSQSTTTSSTSEVTKTEKSISVEVSESSRPSTSRTGSPTDISTPNENRTSGSVTASMTSENHPWKENGGPKTTEEADVVVKDTLVSTTTPFDKDLSITGGSEEQESSTKGGIEKTTSNPINSSEASISSKEPSGTEVPRREEQNKTTTVVTTNERNNTTETQEPRVDITNLLGGSTPTEMTNLTTIVDNLPVTTHAPDSTVSLESKLVGDTSATTKAGVHETTMSQNASSKTSFTTEAPVPSTAEALVSTESLPDVVITDILVGTMTPLEIEGSTVGPEENAVSGSTLHSEASRSLEPNLSSTSAAHDLQSTTSSDVIVETTTSPIPRREEATTKSSVVSSSFNITALADREASSSTNKPDVVTKDLLVGTTPTLQSTTDQPQSISINSTRSGSSSSVVPNLSVHPKSTPSPTPTDSTFSVLSHTAGTSPGTSSTPKKDLTTSDTALHSTMEPQPSTGPPANEPHLNDTSSAAPPSMTPPSFETTVTGETPATELYGSTETTTMASTTTTVPSIITTDDGVEVHTEQQKHAREHLKHAREHLKHGRCSADDRSECHELAICDLFSGSCKCKDGFEGDGFSTCRQVTNIDCVSNSSICHEQATCDRHTRRCACASGFIGDGILCSPDPQDCVIRSDLCSPDAMCSGRRCRCVEGFTGDGVKCVSLHQRSANCSECDANAHCDLGVCTCNPGYFGNGLCCVPDPRDCVHFPGICHPEAGCDRNKRQCACNKGFLGDGISCFPAVSCVSDPSVCHKNAICLPSGHCTCMRGFTGNGHHCERKFLSSPRQELQNQPSPCDNRCNRETQLCIDGDCVCKQGYDSINGDCQDIDECAISSPCHHLAACQNLRGSFSCHCPEGYIGDGHTCIQQLRIGELGVVCEPDGMTLVLANETQMFEGRIFVRGQAENPKCTKTFSPLQQHSRPYTFKVPFEHCNVRLEANDTFATTVIVQKHPMFITTSADSYDLKCTYPVGSTEVESHVNVSELATTSTLSDQADGPICKLTVNNELKESVESATVGQALTLRLEVSPSGTYSILPKNCFAINIETGERYSLTDKAGCAIDNDLFPDWAKVSSSVSQAIFRTFKWPDSQIIRFQCDCDACHGDCPEVDCQKRREAAARVFRFRRAHPTGEVPQDALEVETEKEEKALASKTVDSHRVAFSRLITVHEETEEKMAQEEVEHFHKGGSFLSESLPTVSRFPTEGVCFRTAVLAGSALLLVLSLGFLTTTALRRSRKAEAPPTDSPISVISF